ncbi:MAG: hypothetical protein KDH88_13880 [Chromatiales bacterium]|nr:hypothetical protein [Chromatiales bacterium]
MLYIGNYIRLFKPTIKLIVYAAPQALDKDGVNPPTLSIHADAIILQGASEILAGELAYLIRAENLRNAIPVDRFFQGLYTEADVERSGHTPRQHLTRMPAHNRIG